MVCIKKMELVQQSGGLSHPKNGVSPPTMRSLITKMRGVFLEGEELAKQHDGIEPPKTAS
jgi:hypothetical protein